MSELYIDREALSTPVVQSVATAFAVTDE